MATAFVPVDNGKVEIVLLNRSRIVVAVVALASVLLTTTPASAALVASTGNVVVLASPPASVELGQLTSNEHGFVFTERTCAVLTGNLAVDVVNPVGTYSETQVQPGTIPAGTKVDSYLVHLDEATNQGLALNGSLTFDRPVLGLIFLVPTLNASDAVVGAPATTYPTGSTPSRGYELASDRVQVSANRRTVTFSSSVGTPGFQDDLRIITEGTCTGRPQPPPGQDKVTVCHKPGTPDEKAMEVPRTALAAHLGHGDSEGPCGPAGPRDADGDGFNNDVDCNDADPSIHPGAKDQVNDGIDQDCNGSDLVDADNDLATVEYDCNDSDPSIHPWATDIPNDGIDQNCDGSDLVMPVDADGDGFNVDDDCNDTDASINPGATDVPGDGIDQNCDGVDAVPGEFLIRAGQTATLSDTVINACNHLAYGYQPTGGELRYLGEKPYGCTSAPQDDVTIGPFLSDVSIRIVLVDFSCNARSYDSTGDHAAVTGSNPYDVDITDAGTFCESEGEARPPGPLGGNLSTTLTIS